MDGVKAHGGNHNITQTHPVCISLGTLDHSIMALLPLRVCRGWGGVTWLLHRHRGSLLNASLLPLLSWKKRPLALGKNQDQEDCCGSSRRSILVTVPGSNSDTDSSIDMQKYWEKGKQLQGQRLKRRPFRTVLETWCPEKHRVLLLPVLPLQHHPSRTSSGGSFKGISVECHALCYVNTRLPSHFTFEAAF